MLVWGIVIVMYELFGEDYTRDVHKWLGYNVLHGGYQVFKRKLVSKPHIPSFLKAFLGTWSGTEPHDASYFSNSTNETSHGGEYTLQRLKKDIERQEKLLLHQEMKHL